MTMNRVCALTGAEFPLFAFSHCRDVVAAVSKAGGFGVLGATRFTPEQLKEELDWIDAHVDGAPYGVDVLIAAPSFVATNIGNDQRQIDGIARPGSATDGMDYMTPEAAAEEILRGLGRRQPMIPVGRVARLAWWVNSLAPRLYQRLMERQIGGHEG